MEAFTIDMQQNATEWCNRMAATERLRHQWCNSIAAQDAEGEVSTIDMQQNATEWCNRMAATECRKHRWCNRMAAPDAGGEVWPWHEFAIVGQSQTLAGALHLCLSCIGCQPIVLEVYRSVHFITNQSFAFY